MYWLRRVCVCVCWRVGRGPSRFAVRRLRKDAVSNVNPWLTWWAPPPAYPPPSPSPPSTPNTITSYSFLLALYPSFCHSFLEAPSLLFLLLLSHWVSISVVSHLSLSPIARLWANNARGERGREGEGRVWRRRCWADTAHIPVWSDG